MKKLAAEAPQDITPGGILPVTPAKGFLVGDNSIYFYGPPPADLNISAGQKVYRMKKDGTQAPLVVANIATDNISSWTQDKTPLFWGTYGQDAASPGYYSAVYKLAK